MIETDGRPHVVPIAERGATRAPHSAFKRMMICVDRSPVARRVVAHAAAIAEAMGSTMTFAQVIESDSSGRTLPDPVECEVYRREAKAAVEALVRELGDGEEPQIVVAEGCATERLGRLADDHNIDLAVFGSLGDSGGLGSGLGRTVRSCVEIINSSVMIVPGDVACEEPGLVRYRRIMAPLDTSAQAERALPIAMRIAEAHGAELLLVHAVVPPLLTRSGPPEPEDHDLSERIHRRNERVSSRYLNRIRSQLHLSGVRYRMLVLTEEDTRRALARAIAREHADLVVLSAHGLGCHSDVPFGSTAEYLMRGAATPMIVIRDPAKGDRRPNAGIGAAIRPLSRALS